MPITKSASKALRRDNRRAQVNKSIRSKLKAGLKEGRQNPSKKNLKSAYSLLDRAAKKKIIHKNKASRLKSNLAKLLKK